GEQARAVRRQRQRVHLRPLEVLEGGGLPLRRRARRRAPPGEPEGGERKGDGRADGWPEGLEAKARGQHKTLLTVGASGRGKGREGRRPAAATAKRVHSKNLPLLDES